VLNPAQNCQNQIGPGNALQDRKSFTMKLVGLWSKMVTTQYHLPTYCIDRVVQYFQNVTVACTVSLMPTYCSNNLRHPALSGIIVLNPAQNCQNQIGPGNGLQDMKSFTIKLVGLWSKMVTTQYHLPYYCIDRVVRYFQNSIQDDNQTFHLLKAIQDETHHQEMRKYGPLQSIQDDNQTFHLLKAIQDETHHQEMRKYGPLQSIQDDNQTFHLLQAIQHELHHKHGTITDSVCFRNSLTYAK
jgi:hypothetical protein